MTPEAVLTALGDATALEDVRKGWDASGAALPEGAPAFLTDAGWQENACVCGFGPETAAAMARVAAAVRGHPALRRLAWHGYWRVFLSPEPAAPNGWPEPTALLGDDAGVFYLLIAMAVVPLLRERHRQWGFPEAVTRDTAQQVRHYCEDNYRRGHQGRPGVYLSQMGWLRHYTRERYVRLGRLEFWLGPNPYRFEAYRHRTSRQVVALAAAGTRFAANGTIYRDPKDYRDGEGWTSTLTHTPDHVSGFPIDPNGRGLPRQVTLPLAEWTRELQAGDPCLMLHIPSGGGMTLEACDASLREAATFFARHFPHEAPRAVVCTSWIFSPQLQEIFPPEANLCRFQRNLYLFPVASNNGDGLWFVFLRHGPYEAATLPRDTSLQRGIADFLARGGRWHMAGMFFLFADLPAFGQEPYRRGWPPAGLT